MATSMSDHPAAAPPRPPVQHGHGGDVALAAAGVGLLGVAGWWWWTHRTQTPATNPPPASGNHFTAGSTNPSLLTPQGWGLPAPGEIPCYGQVAPYANQGVTTTIGAGPAPPIPWSTPLTQVGPVISAPWPAHPGVAGTAYWFPTNYKGCLVSDADVTPAD